MVMVMAMVKMMTLQARCERWEKEVASTNATADHLEDQVDGHVGHVGHVGAGDGDVGDGDVGDSGAGAGDGDDKNRDDGEEDGHEWAFEMAKLNIRLSVQFYTGEELAEENPDNRVGV